MVNCNTPLAGHRLQDVKGNVKTTQTRQIDVSLFAMNCMTFKTIAVSPNEYYTIFNKI